MKLFYHEERKAPSSEQIKRELRQAYGINNPERVIGFQSFTYVFDDIYVCGRLEKSLENNPDLADSLNEMIKRFEKEDYGFVSGSEWINNVENKWLGGDCSRTVGRYSLEQLGGVVLEFLDDVGLLYYIEDDMTEVYRYFGVKPHFLDIQYVSRNLK